MDLASDPSGNVILTGSFADQADLGGDPVVCAGGFDIYLAKWDDGGGHQWTKRFGGGGVEVPKAIATNDSGEIFLSSAGDGVISFGGGNLVPAGGQDVFVAKLDGSGGHQWSRRFGEQPWEACERIAIALSGEVVLGCGITAPVDFGTGPLMTPGSDQKGDAVVVKLGP